jgi:hypothetical protein
VTEAIDMSRFIEARSDQLNSDDLLGAPRTVTITKGTGCEGDQPIAIYFEGDNGKPFKPCKTIRRVLVAVWGRYASEYVGRSMTLYRDDAVTFGGLQVGGIRISHMSHLDKETIVVVAKSKGKKAGMKIMPLAMEKAKANEPAADKAQVWADKTIAEFAAASVEDTAALVTKHSRALDKLKKDRPELFALVDAAIKVPADDDDPFADDAPHPASATADSILADLEGVQTIAELDKLAKAQEANIAAMPDEIGDTVRGAIDKARTRLAVPA